MAEQPYDPVKRKERYERTKQLKGRTKGASKPIKSSRPSRAAAPPVQVSQDRVIRVREKLNKLRTAMSETQDELKSRRETADGKKTTSSSKLADMSEKDLKARAIKIRGAITVARRLLSDASLEHGQLAHSAIVSEPDVNERFARFQSAERGPST